MIIEYVKTDNLDLLEDAFNTGISNTNGMTKDFGRNLPLLLSHIKISFIINEISILEAYMLKRFCNGDLIDIETYMDDNKIDKNKYQITHRTMQSLFLLNKNINEDNDVSVKPGVLLFPSKCVEKKCLITFQGQNVLSIIGSLVRTPDCFFIQLKNAMAQNPEKSKDEIISDLLIHSLMKEFYTFMITKIQYIDVLTDSTLDSVYLKHAKENTNDLVSLSHVNTIYGDIPFINIDGVAYANSLDEIDRNMTATKLIGNKDLTMNTTEIFFVCNTSFYTFMELFLYLPIGCIVESTDIKITYSSDEYIIPQEMKKYQSRITSIIEKMRDERVSVSKDNNIDNYNLIPLNTRVQYSIRFKLSEISNILMTLEKKISDDHIYGDENNYLVREMLKMTNLMKKYAIAVYKTLIK